MKTDIVCPAAAFGGHVSVTPHFTINTAHLSFNHSCNRTIIGMNDELAGCRTSENLNTLMFQ